jgi:hypothetical protein
MLRGGSTIRRGPTQDQDPTGKDGAKGKGLRLADEVRRIQRLAAAHDSRVVTLGPLVLFSTISGDAWMLDPADHLATPLAREGDPLPVHIEETDTTFAIGWSGHYRIDDAAFVYQDDTSGRVRAILGYPTQHISHQG